MLQHHTSGLKRIFTALVVAFFVQCSLATEFCNNNVYLDIMFAVDNTLSMDPSIKNLRKQLPALLEFFRENYPNTYFGFVSFNDRWLGCEDRNAYDNYCARLELPLTDDADSIKRRLSKVAANFGGGKLPEDSLGALLISSLDPNAGWRTMQQGENYLRLIILVTDARPRWPTDKIDCPGPYQRENDGDADYDCRNEDYPSIPQVRVAMERMQTVPIFLTLLNQERVFEDLRRELGRGGIAREMSSHGDDIQLVIQSVIPDVVCDQNFTTSSTAFPTTGKGQTDRTGEGQTSGTDSDDTFQPTGVPGEGGHKPNPAVIGASVAGGIVVAAAAAGAALRYGYFAQGPGPDIVGDFSFSEETENLRDNEQTVAIDESGYA